MIRRNRLVVLILGFLLVTPFEVAKAQAQDFYQGKTIRVVVATTPGGGFDAYSRMLARHMGKYIPGHPTFVVENMPGAAFLIGTNFLYRQAKPDGLTLGNVIAEAKAPGRGQALTTDLDRDGRSDLVVYAPRAPEGIVTVFLTRPSP